MHISTTNENICLGFNLVPSLVVTGLSANYSVSVTQTPLSSLESVNSFSILSSDPDLESIDSVSETERGNPSRPPHIAKKQAPGLRPAILTVLNINFWTLNNPQTRDEFYTLLDQTNPDIVIGSETWLNSDINNAEIVPDDMGFEIFRQDKSSRGGGILILVSKRYIAHRVEQFETECKILWVNIEIKGYCSILSTT